MVVCVCVCVCVSVCGCGCECVNGVYVCYYYARFICTSNQQYTHTHTHTHTDKVLPLLNVFSNIPTVAVTLSVCS